MTRSKAKNHGTQQNPLQESVLEEFVERDLDNRDGSVSLHGPLPLTLAVTGHRDVCEEHLDKLEALLRSEFQTLQQAYPSTSMILLSALAEGADRITARVALELKMRVIVPLPMAQEDYEQDFDEQSKIEFHELLGQAEHHFALPLVEGNSKESIATHGNARDLQYAQLGAYLASHCQILFALWDGRSPEKTGGTSQVVKFKLQGVPEPFAKAASGLDAPDSGPVYHVMTPRVANKECTGQALTTNKLYPPGFQSTKDAAQAFDDIYDRIEVFNRDAVKHRETLAEQIQKSKSYVLPKKYHAKLPSTLGQALELYAIADVLSQRFQRRTHITLRILLTFVFFAAASYDIYAHLFEEDNLVLSLYLILFSFAYLSYRWAERYNYQTKYLDYRALAEGLRVQFFWKLGMIRDSVADHYMRKQKSELDWIRDAIRSCMIETSTDNFSDETGKLSLDARLHLVSKHWVDDQSNYFKKSSSRDHHRLHRAERNMTYLFVAALALAALQLFIKFSVPIILAMGLLPVLGAILHTYQQKNALFEQSKQYNRMSVFFHRATLHLKVLLEFKAYNKAQEFLAELGKEALVENGDWILTHRERPLEVPKGA